MDFSKHVVIKYCVIKIKYLNQDVMIKDIAEILSRMKLDYIKTNDEDDTINFISEYTYEMMDILCPIKDDKDLNMIIRGLPFSVKDSYNSDPEDELFIDIMKYLNGQWNLSS